MSSTFALAVFLVVPWLAVWGKERKVSLKCYQCKGDSRDALPLCDTDFWKLTTREEKRGFLFQCPSRKSGYCVKKVDQAETYRTTFRGCVGNLDESETPLREGCRIDRAASSEMCLCAGNACNGAPAGRAGAAFTLLLAAVSIATPAAPG